MMGRARRLCGFIGKWRVADGVAPLRKVVANKNTHQSRYRIFSRIS